ncbi:MAG: YqaA family protein [Lentisphaeria bacterium]|jgi:membrane protein YqaA with SNARE-associated domain
MPEAAKPAPRRSWLRRLYDWTLHWADTPYGLPALALLSFAESSFFPVPPDVLLSALCFARPKRWFTYALVCSAASVIGGIFGWLIGMFLWEATSHFFFSHIPGFTEAVFSRVQDAYQENAFLAILTAAFTPIPYKVFTIASGVFQVGLGVLIGASALGRSGRFFLVAALIRQFGPRIRPFLERNFEWAALALGALGLLGFLLIKWL